MLKRLIILLFAVIAANYLSAQDFRINLFGGMANYNGDLQAKTITFQQSRYAIGAWVSYDLNSVIMLRGGFYYGKVEAADRFQTNPANQIRNLSFATNLWELHTAAEFHFLGMDNRVFSPYIFGGLAAFHFNPYAFDAGNNKIFLKPLSTEGQGVTGYPDRNPYNLIQLAIPFGVGVRMVLTDRIDVGAEFGYRKTFTDYLDDVSSSYIDQAVLLTERGPKAVEMAYRTPELAGHISDPYPANLEKRGSAAHNDNYYFFGLTLSYRFTGGDKFNNRRRMNGGGKYRSKMGCPVNVL